MRTLLSELYAEVMDVVSSDYKFSALESLSRSKQPVKTGYLCRGYSKDQHLSTPSHMEACLEELSRYALVKKTEEGMYTMSDLGRIIFRSVKRVPEVRKIGYSSTGNRDYNEEKIMTLFFKEGDKPKEKILSESGIGLRTANETLRKLEKAELVRKTSDKALYLKLDSKVDRNILNESEKKLYEILEKRYGDWVRAVGIIKEIPSGTFWYGKKCLSKREVMSQKRTELTYGLTTKGKKTAFAINRINQGITKMGKSGKAKKTPLLNFWKS